MSTNTRIAADAGIYLGKVVDAAAEAEKVRILEEEAATETERIRIEEEAAATEAERVRIAE